MILATVQYIWELLSEMIKSILQLDTIFYVGLGFLALMTAFIFIKSSLSYESKLTKSVNRLNNWLLKNRTINEQNLVEFNKMIKNKKCPKVLRKHWQQYMLYRDKMPSEYISTYNCIDKPGKTSSFTSNIKNYISIYKITALITFFFSLISFSGKSDSSIIYYVSMTLVSPAIILLFGVIFTLVLRSMQNHNIADLYQTFHIFTRYIDKASTTIPKYVDFEILFTEKEIKDGIPILGEYLEKRARQEQEELEEAQRNAVAHEEYNFAESGVDGSLMLERAMKESETYLNAKQRIFAEIQQFESEISTLQKNYENTSKDYQRKLQASKENMERLRQQQEESTNRIEINYIRKQQQDEVKKQEQLEHDQDDATNKFNTEIKSLNEEINKRKNDLEIKRLRVQEAMESEYQTFAVKLHKAVSTDVEKENDSNIQKINLEKEQYAQAITYLKGEVDNKDQIILAKDQLIAELTNRLELLSKGEISVSEINSENAPSSQEEQPVEATPVSSESEDGYYDNKGYYWFNDGTYYDDQGLYHDLEGNVYDAEGNLKATNMVVETDSRVPKAEQTSQSEIKDEVTEQATPIQNEEETSQIEQPQETIEEAIQNETINENSQPIEEVSEIQDIQPEEVVPENHEEQVESIQETIETQENIEPISESIIDEPIEETVEEAVEEITKPEEEITQEESKEIETGYDDKGNYRYKDGSYYDLDNLYHDINGNTYNTEGILLEEKTENQSTEEQSEEETLNNENVSEQIEEEVEPQVEETNHAEEEFNSQENTVEPKDKSLDTEQTDELEEIEDKPENGNEIQEIKENDSEVYEEQKRKAGRPRKEVSEEELNKPKRSVGRPRKEVSEEELNKPKRSVGRPKKEVSEEELNKPKRSVGRPKKQVSEEELNKPKRSVGRPKKEETEEQSTEILKHLGQSLLDLSEQKSKKKRATKKTNN